MRWAMNESDFRMMPRTTRVATCAALVAVMALVTAYVVIRPPGGRRHFDRAEVERRLVGAPVDDARRLLGPPREIVPVTTQECWIYEHLTRDPGEPGALDGETYLWVSNGRVVRVSYD